MKKLYKNTIVFTLAGLFLGITTGFVNKHVNLFIHDKLSHDGPAVTLFSLIVQVMIMLAVLVVAATYLPTINVNDLGGGLPSFCFLNLYFAGQIHLVNEITKFVDNKFDGNERYK